MKRGFILFASLFLVLFLGIFLGMAFLRSSVQLEAMDVRRASLYAFYAAEAGIDNTIFFLRGNLGWTGVLYNNQSLIWQEGSTQQETVGFYNTEVRQDLNPNVYWIRSIGQDAERRINPGRVILARVNQESPTNFLTSTISDVRIFSGAVIGGNILARDVTFAIDTALPSAQRAIVVNGDVEYMRNIFNYPHPDVTVNGTVTQRPPITFAGVDLDRYRGYADNGGRHIPADQVPAGGYVISRNIDWASLATGNGLVLVEGDVRISGTVTQSIHIISAGDIYIENDLRCPPVDGIAPQIGLSAFDDVFIPVSAPNTLNIDAYIVANGGIFRADGVVSSKDTLNFFGAISVRGKTGEPTAVALNVYRNRNITYNPALGNAISIPFLTFIVNIAYWEEVKDPYVQHPTAPFPPLPRP